MQTLTFDYNRNPVDIVEFFKEEKNLFFLDSNSQESGKGRFSLLGFDPFDFYQAQGEEALDNLKKKFNSFREKSTDKFVPCPSGIVGCLSYDYGLEQEKIQSSVIKDIILSDVVFGFYDLLITFDHWKHKIIITSSGLPEKNEHLKKLRSVQRLTNVSQKIKAFLEKQPQRTGLPEETQKSSPLNLQSNLSYSQYIQKVEKAKEYIREGEIYQVNLSQRFVFDPQAKIENLQLYRALREFSPCGFGGYFDGGNFQLISNSPEQFVITRDQKLTTSPMKGTRPRGSTDLLDNQFLKEIQESSKDKAELMMITDLLRNDLGKVCDYHSIKVKTMRAIEKYKTVFQATSTIEGRLQNQKDAFDILKACFPGGSITGCPKIRSMEIIDELESVNRSFYTGSLGYISFSGNMDFNILIRTILAYQEKYYFQVGGGIVADSVPHDEYEETMVKARAIIHCLEQVQSKDKKKVEACP